jgi:hypothetical protein
VKWRMTQRTRLGRDVLGDGRGGKVKSVQRNEGSSGEQRYHHRINTIRVKNATKIPKIQWDLKGLCCPSD